MGTIAEQLQSILNSKAAIKTAIENKGVTNVGDVLEEYASKIDEINTGSTGISDAPSDGKKYVRQNTTWVEETKYDLSNLATLEDLNNKADASSIPTKTSQLTNDSGYIITELDPTVPSWAKQTNKPSYTASEVGAIAIGGLKTINGQSIEGSGNITIEGSTSSGGSTTSDSGYIVSNIPIDGYLYIDISNNSTNKNLYYAILKERLDGMVQININLYNTTSAHKQEAYIYISELINAGNITITSPDGSVSDTILIKNENGSKTTGIINAQEWNTFHINMEGLPIEFAYHIEVLNNIVTINKLN